MINAATAKLKAEEARNNWEEQVLKETYQIIERAASSGNFMVSIPSGNMTVKVSAVLSQLGFNIVKIENSLHTEVSWR